MTEFQPLSLTSSRYRFPRIGRTIPPATAALEVGQLVRGMCTFFRKRGAVPRFEEELTEYFGVRHCYTVSSGKAALVLILRALHELNPLRDEVLIPAYTCYSVPSAIVRAGLKVRLCDLAPGTFDFDHDQLPGLMADERLLAVIPTHLYGVPADVEKVWNLAQPHGVFVIEDAAQAMGSEWNGRKLGTVGDVGLFSLGRGKAFSTVEGGIILTDNERIGQALRRQAAELEEYNSMSCLKLALYAVAMMILTNPWLYWLPRSLPFLKIGRTEFDTDFPLARLSWFQAGLAVEWQSRIAALKETRRRNVQRFVEKGILPILGPSNTIPDPILSNSRLSYSSPFKGEARRGMGVIRRINAPIPTPTLPLKGREVYLNRGLELSMIPDLLRFPVLASDERTKTQIISTSEALGLGVSTGYPDSIDRIPELAGQFDRDSSYPVAREQAARLVALPVHSYVTEGDTDVIGDLLQNRPVQQPMPTMEMLKIPLLIVLWTAAFAPLFPELVRDWLDNSDNSHAFLVPFISLFFIWQRRDLLLEIPARTSRWGGGLLAVSLLGYVVSSAGGTAFPARIAMVASLFALFWFCLGGGKARLLAFPLGFLLFMVPIPYSLLSLVSGRLQLMATSISEKLISHCAIPVYREGNMLYFVQTQLEVAEACSGIRSIVSLTMISLVFCFLSRKGWWRKVSLILAAIPIAIAANIVRVTGTGVLAHYFGDRVARGFLHEFSGIVVFIFGFALLFSLFQIINRVAADDLP